VLVRMRPANHGLLTASSHDPCTGDRSVLSSRARVGSFGTAKCPESLCPRSALPLLERRFPPLRRALPLRLRSYGLMRRSCQLSSPSVVASFEESTQVATSPCCQQDLPDVISANPSSDAWSPTTTVPPSAFTCFFLGVIGLPQNPIQVGFPFHPRTRFFPRTGFRGCRHSFMFRPPSLLASQIAPTAAFSRRAAETFTSGQNVRRYLRTHRICYPSDTGN